MMVHKMMIFQEKDLNVFFFFNRIKKSDGGAISLRNPLFSFSFLCSFLFCFFVLFFNQNNLHLHTHAPTFLGTLEIDKQLIHMLLVKVRKSD